MFLYRPFKKEGHHFMSEQRSTQNTSRRSFTTMQRAYLATLARRLYARHLFPAMGPGDINHAIATRIAQLQRRR